MNFSAMLSKKDLVDSATQTEVYDNAGVNMADATNAADIISVQLTRLVVYRPKLKVSN
jgi:hypothetical protein